MCYRITQRILRVKVFEETEARLQPSVADEDVKNWHCYEICDKTTLKKNTVVILNVTSVRKEDTRSNVDLCRTISISLTSLAFNDSTTTNVSLKKLQ